MHRVPAIQLRAPVPLIVLIKPNHNPLRLVPRD